MQLTGITSGDCWLHPSTVDGELCMKHEKESGVMTLVALMAKHVDDLKLTGKCRLSNTSCNNLRKCLAS